MQGWKMTGETDYDEERGGTGRTSCGEELRGLGVHLVRRALERGDAEEDEAGEDGDLKDDPEGRPYVRGHSGVHDAPLCCVRVVSFAEVLVVRDIP